MHSRLTPMVVVVAAGLAVPQLAPSLSDLFPPRTLQQTPMPVPVQGCCKHCSAGKPCGDSCIARNKTCHVGPGCAC